MMKAMHPRSVGWLLATPLLCVFAVSCSPVAAAIQVKPPDQVAFEISPGTATPARELGAAVKCFRKQDFKGCWKLLTAASAKHKELPPPRLMLARFFLVHDQLPPAHVAMEQAAAESPDYPGVYITFGKLALTERRVTDAQVHFTHARQLIGAKSWSDGLDKGFHVQICEGLASVASARGNWQRAEKHLNQWLELAPTSSTARSRLARVLFAMKRPDDAYEQFRLAAKGGPTAELPSVAMGWLYGQSGDLDKAYQWMKRSLQESPGDARSHLGMATWLTQQGEFERGRREAEIGLRLDPDSYNARLLCGFLAWSQEDYSAAEKLLQTLHDQNPEDLKVSCQLALVLADQTNSSKRSLAMELVEANVKSFPSSPDVLATTGWVYFRCGQLARAEEILQRAISRRAGQPQTACFLAHVLVARGRAAEAKPLLEKAISSSKAFVFRPKAEALLKQIGEAPLRPAATKGPASGGKQSP